jgi:hypothetical protein
MCERVGGCTLRYEQGRPEQLLEATPYSLLYSQGKPLNGYYPSCLLFLAEQMDAAVVVSTQQPLLVWFHYCL